MSLSGRALTTVVGVLVYLAVFVYSFVGEAYGALVLGAEPAAGWPADGTRSSGRSSCSRPRAG